MNKKYGVYFLISIIVLSTSFLFSQQAEARAIKNIGFQNTANQVEVSIEYDGDVDFESFILFGANRLAIDLPGIEKVSSSPEVDVNEMGITSIRSALYSPGLVRVVLDFSDEIPQYKIEDSENGLKIFFWKEAKAENIPIEEAVTIEKEVIVPVERKLSKPIPLVP